PVGEPASTLEHEVHAQRFPRALLGLLDRRHFDGLAVDDQCIALRLDGARETAVDGIVLQEMRERLGVGNVVHRHELERLLLHEHRGPEHVAPDATEPVDPDTHCHGSPLGEVRHDGPAEGRGQNRAGPGLVQRAGRLGQRGAGREYIVYQNEGPFERGTRNAERGTPIRPSVPRSAFRVPSFKGPRHVRQPRIPPARTPPATRRTAGKPRTAARAARNGGTTARERGASGDGTRRTPAGRNRGTRGGRGTTGTRLGGGAARPPHAPRARLTAARITSSGAASSGKKRLNAAAPWCTSTSRPSCARTPAAVSVRTQRVLPGAYTRSRATCRWAALSGSSGNGSGSLSPAGVALMAMSGRSLPRAGSARVPCPRAQAAKSRARAASRDSTCRSAFAVAAATATARAEPPVPSSSQMPAPSAPSWRRAARIPATSVLSPTSAPCSVQNVLQAPTRAHTSVF